MDQVEIRADGLLVRPWRDEDAAEVHRACQDSQIQRWTAVPRPYRAEDAQAFVGAHTREGWASGSRNPWGIFDATTGELLGSVALGRLDAEQAELGYWVAPWARGRGVATQASRAVAAWGFRTRGLQLIQWHAEVGNHASRLVALRIGVRVTGEVRRLTHAHPARQMQAWVGSVLPHELTWQAPAEYQSGSLIARRAAVFGGVQPSLPLPGGGHLRPWREADLEPATRSCQDPLTVQFTTVPSPYTLADAQAYLFDHSPRAWARGDQAVFAIADQHDDFIGAIDLRLDPLDPQVGEVGFSVAPWARGHGHAAGALRVLSHWGFDALGLERIQWRAHTGNEASRRVAEKAGYTIEGLQRATCAQRGQRRDAMVGALLASDPR